MNSEKVEEEFLKIQKNHKELAKSNKKEVENQTNANDKKMIARHKFLYEELQKCTDVNKYNQLRKEFAELDMKVARIMNKDLTQKSRCEVENLYTVVK